MRKARESAAPDAVGAQIAVVGSGPSGCYAAQFLMKADPSARVTVFDRLPVPFGLVRYGVAADHQGTKAVIRQFERLFDSPRVLFAGNVELGRDLSVTELFECFDAVILATGLHDDRLLETQGARLPGVVGAGVLTRFLNGHPDEHGEALEVGGDVVVIGAGNVAVDVVRLLAKATEHYEGSDMDDEAHRRLSATLRSVTLVARSSAEAAKFDRAMIRELGDIPGAAIEVHGLDADASDPKSETVRALVTSDAENPRVRISLRFQTEPLEIVGAERVEGLRVSHASGRHVIPAQTIVTAIGFTGERGRFADPRVHTVGWVRRGPVGTIPDNRTDARQVADEVLASLPAQASARAGFSGLPQTVQERAVGIDHWRHIDAREIADAGEGRARRKIRTWAGLLEGIREPVLAAPGPHDTDFHDSKGTDR